MSSSHVGLDPYAVQLCKLFEFWRTKLYRSPQPLDDIMFSSRESLGWLYVHMLGLHSTQGEWFVFVLFTLGSTTSPQPVSEVDFGFFSRFRFVLHQITRAMCFI